MLKLARCSTTHRLLVVLGWIALPLVIDAISHSAGTSYSNNFTLPHSDAQRASDLQELGGASGTPPSGSRRGSRPDLATEGVEG